MAVPVTVAPVDLLGMLQMIAPAVVVYVTMRVDMAVLRVRVDRLESDLRDLKQNPPEWCVMFGKAHKHENN
jgi:hypothetical protein